MLGIVDPTPRGPLEEYDERVHSHKLRDDDHQRGKFNNVILEARG